jgi:hypothetical protein
MHTPAEECPEPIQTALVEPYCFDEVTEEERQRFEAHLLRCDHCWREVQHLQAHVGMLRSDRQLAETVMTPEVLGVLGMSGALDRLMAGHGRYVLLASALYALLFAIPVVAEVAYQFDRFGRLAVLLAPPVFLYVAVTALAAFWIDVWAIRAGTNGFTRSLAVLVLATVVLCLLLLPLLPSAPTVAASFQTYPVRLGYLKSVFYAWLAGPLLVLWPFHFVVTMQAHLAGGRYAQILGVLNRDKTALPPRNTPFIPVWVLVWYVVGLFAFNYFGLTHLFENLQPGPYMSLFMTVVLIRVTAWLLLAVIAVLWYANSLTELKRECQAVLSLRPPRRPGEAAGQMS